MSNKFYRITPQASLSTNNIRPIADIMHSRIGELPTAGMFDAVLHILNWDNLEGLGDYPCVDIRVERTLDRFGAGYKCGYSMEIWF